MSREIDERIVEMRFDNKQFESATKQTMSTLASLKKALNLDAAAKGLDSVANAISTKKLSSISQSLSALEKRFSVFGTFTYRILENAADDIYKKVTTTIGATINYVTSAIKDGGLKRAMNMENAHFQLQALLKDEEKVQAVMADASKSVDGTAYSLDAAAKAASQFAASGLQAGDDMLNALRGVVGVAAMTNSEYESISNIFTTVAGNGRLMGDQLLQLSGRGLNAASTLSDFFNGVNSGSKQASESVTAAIQTLTDGLQVSEGDIRDWVSKGKISFAMFSEAMTEAFADSAERANETFNGSISNMRSAFARIGAGFYEPLIAQNSNVVKLINSVRVRINDVKKALVFDEQIGNVNALSKQWTDFVLNLAESATKWVDNVDLSKPLATFYYTIESGKNILKGLLGVLDNIGVAFQNVFHDYMNADIIVDVAAKLEELTSKFQLTDKGAANLRRTFRGLFDILKLVGEGVFDFIKAIIPTKKGTDGLADSVLDLTGDLGGLLSKFAKWVRESKTLNKIFDILTGGIRKVLEFILNLNVYVKDFIETMRGIPEVNAVIEAMVNLFEAIGKKSAPYVKDFTGKIKDFKGEIMNLDLSKPMEWLQKLADAIQKLADTILDPNGLAIATKNAGEYMDRFKEGFNFDNVVSKLEFFQDTIGKFSDWIKTTLGPAFEGFNFGGLIAATGGGTMVYAILKMAQSLEVVSKTIGSFKKIPDFFGNLNKTLKAYQDNLKADTLLKIAAAIGILTLSIIGLSFIDTKKAIGAAGALAIIAGTLGAAIAAILYAINKGKGLDSALQIFAKGLNKGINNITKGIKWKMIGSAVKDMGKALAYIAASIVALALMYGKDKESFTVASRLVGAIFAALILVIAAFSLLGEKLDKGMKNFGKAAFGIAALGVAITLIVGAINKLFGMTIPYDWDTKLKILGEVLLGLAALTVVIGLASRIGGGNKLPTGPILALTAFLYVAVLSLDKIFKMDLPKDWMLRLGMLEIIMITLAGIAIAIGYAGKLSGGNMKATGSILAMCAFLAVVVASIMILALVPWQKLISGSLAIGVVLMALGVALYGAAKVSDKNTYKTVLAMAAVVAAIAGSLGILALIPWQKLAKSCAAIGSMLLLVALDFVAISKTGGDHTWKSVAALAVIIAEIAASLFVLAGKPWKELLASAGSLSAVLLAMAGTFVIIGKSNVNTNQILDFLAASISILVIGDALSRLASYPWSSLLAAGVSLSLTIAAFGKTFEFIGKSDNVNLGKIASFLAATLAVYPIAEALGNLATYPWEGLLAAGVALSLTVAAFGVAYALIGQVGGSALDALKNVGSFLLLTLAIIPIGVALAVLADQNWEGMIPVATAVSEMLLAFAAVFAILVAIGPVATGAIVAIGVFDLFIASFALVLLALGALLENETTKRLLNGGMEVMGKLGQAIGDFCGNIIAGIGSGIGKAIEEVGDGLGAFWEKAQPFFDGVSTIDPKCLEGVKTIAQAVLILTASDFISGIASFLGIETTSLAEFGEQLALMGPSLAEYGRAVADINPSKVKASAAAIEILATAAAKLPRSSGWVDKIFGTKQTLADFGKELEKFGPHLKKYADSVSGIDRGVVEDSAAAAGALAELEGKLPKHGGILQAWLGDNNLEEFGKHLEQFGKSLSNYSRIITANGGLNQEAIESSAAAGKILTEMADTVPNSGGLIAEFFGDNNIDTFGRQLIVFGGSLANYVKVTEGIDSETVKGSAAAGQMLVDLSNSLENSGGFVSLFTGDNTLDRFAGQLVDFGQGLSDYYDEIKPIVLTKLNGVTEGISELSKIVKTLPNKGEMTTFVTDLKNAGVDGLTGFLDNFRGVSLGATTMLLTSWGTSVVSAVKSALPEEKFRTIGANAMAKLNEGIGSKKAVILATLSAIGTSISSSIQNIFKTEKFITYGQNIPNGLITGINNKKGGLLTTVKSVCDSIKTKLRTELQNASFVTIGSNVISSIGTGMSGQKQKLVNIANNISAAVKAAFKSLGQQAAQGMIEGMNNKQKNVEETAKAMAKAAEKAVKASLQIKSPSRVFRSIGGYLSEGLALGMRDGFKEVIEAGNTIAESATDPIAYAVDQINELLSKGIDDTLTLTPLLDLTQIRTGAQELSSMLGVGLNLAATYDRALAASTSFAMRAAATAARNTGKESETKETKLEFIQNNYSPKTLSRVELYRQTQNQLAMYEKAVRV